MSTRAFSPRDEAIINGEIEAIFRAMQLPPHLRGEAFSIGWTAFLAVYRSEYWRFMGDGVSGWMRVRSRIADEFLALKRKSADTYYRQCSLDQPVSSEINTPRSELLLPPHGNFVNSVCLWDYLHRLPEDVCLLARHLIDGDSLDEIGAELQWPRQRLLSAFHHLRCHMEVYEAI